MFEEEQPFLMAYRGPFDGFHASEASVSKTCLVRFDNTRTVAVPPSSATSSGSSSSCTARDGGSMSLTVTVTRPPERPS